MTPDSPSDSSSRRDRRRARASRPSTIDLTATEVKAAKAPPGAEPSAMPAPDASFTEGPAPVETVQAVPDTAPSEASVEAAAPVRSSALDESRDGSSAPTDAASAIDPPKPAEEVPVTRTEPTPAAEIATPTEPVAPAPSDEAAPAPVRSEAAGTSVPPVSSRQPAPPPPPVTPAPAARGRFDTHMLAGFLGGLIGAGSIVFANNWFQPPTGRLEARLGQLEERAATAPGSQDALRALDRRLAAVEGSSRGVEDRLRQAQESAQAAAARAQEALARPVPAVPADGAAQPAQPDPAVAELTARLAALEGQVRDRPDPAAAVQALETRVNERLQAAQAEQAPLAERLQGVTGRIEALEGRLAEQTQGLTGRVQSVEQRFLEQVQAITGQVQAVAGQVQAATAQAEARAQALDGRLTEQGGRVATLTQQAAEGPQTLAAGLRVVASDRLADLLREGAPFGEALAALRRLNTEPARLAALEPFAASGAPTGSALAQEFDAVTGQILRETRPPEEGFTDRLWRMADNVVTVRPAGDAAATDPRSLVSRIEGALAGGAFGDAAKAWDALPEAGRRVSQAFGDRLKQRAAASEAARAVSAEALRSLETTTAATQRP